MYSSKKMGIGEKQQQQVIVVPMLNILHSFVDVVVVKYVHGILRSVFDRKKKKTLQRYPICLNDSDHDYILDKIGYRYKTEHENISVEYEE